MLVLPEQERMGCASQQHSHACCVDMPHVTIALEDLQRPTVLLAKTDTLRSDPKFQAS